MKKSAIALLVALAIGYRFYFWIEDKRSRLAFHHAGLPALEVELIAAEQEFLEDQRFVVAFPVFQPVGGGQDAGPVLNPRVVMRDDQEIAPELKLPEGWNLAGVDWLDRSRERDTSELDFTWMAELHGYSSWDPWASPAVTSSDDPHRIFWLPGLLELSGWVKARFIHGLQTEDLPAAVADVRQLAQLLLTAEDYFCALAANRYLGYEALVHRAFVADGGDPGNWEPVPAEARYRFRRVIGRSTLYASVAAPEGVRVTVRDPSLAPIGYCQSAQGVAAANAAVARFAGPPYDARFRAFVAELRAAAPRCRQKRLEAALAYRVTWADLGRSIDDYAGGRVYCDVTRFPCVLLRRDAALAALATSHLAFHDDYDAMAAQYGLGPDGEPIEQRENAPKRKKRKKIRRQ